MLSFIRDKFGPVMIGLIVGLIAFVFIVSGFFSPNRTAGIHEGAVAGLVNGEPIGVREYNREFERRIEFFKNMTGGQMSEAQIQALGLREGVFNEMVQRKLMSQAAERNGLRASDEEVRAQIAQMPVFLKNDRFDPLQYKQVLQANNLTTAGFEKMIREDLSLQGWSTFFRDRVRVTDTEVRDEFMDSEDQRDLRYVLLTNEEGVKLFSVPPAEIEAFLKDEAKLNLAKTRYEAAKDTVFAGRSFDLAKNEIARGLIASEKPAELQAILQKLAVEVAAAMTADKSSDARVNEILRGTGATVKSTGFVPKSAGSLPGIGQAPEMLKDAFAEKSPIDPKDGGRAKTYSAGSWWLVGIVAGKKVPNLANLDAKRAEIRGRILAKKEREISEEFLREMQSKAKIERNNDVLGKPGAAPQAG